MASDSRFAALLEQLTLQLRIEHQRELDERNAEIRNLQSELDSYKNFAVQPKSKNKISPGLSPRSLPLQPCMNRDPGARPPSEPSREPSAQGASTEEQWESVGVDAPQEDQCDRQQDEEVLAPTAEPSPGTASSHWSRLFSSPRDEIQRRLQHRKTRKLNFSGYITHEFIPSENVVLAYVERLVRTNAFDIFFSILIGLNAVVMAVEAQFTSLAVADDYGFVPAPGYISTASEDRARTAFFWISTVFGLLFWVEITLRLIGLRYRFVFEPWNWIDLSLCCLWLLSLSSQLLPVNPMLLRLLRFARLARLIRLVRKFQGFDALFLMATAIKSSISILVWTCCLLSVLMVLLALLLHEVLMDFYLKKPFPLNERIEIYTYFGSFTRSLFSLFELTLANWPTVSRPLIENVSEWFILVTIVHKLVFGFALIGIINGVFIQETFKMAQQDDEVMLRKANTASRLHARKMEELVATVDETGDKILTLAKFRELFREPAIRSWLASMELNPSDADKLFYMMDDGDGALNIEEVTRGVAKFKGAARTIDLYVLLHEQRQHLEEHISKVLSTSTHSRRSISEPAVTGNSI